MSIKKGYPLRLVQELPEEIQKELLSQGITTAEEFVGRAWAAPDKFAEFLGVSEAELRSLTAAISRHIDPKALDEMLVLQEGMPRYLVGSMEPHSREVLDILTGSDWNAGLEHYDFLCRIEFRKDGTGTMKFGGGQVLRLKANFRYGVEWGGESITFKFLDTLIEGIFKHASFKRTDLNAFRRAGFQIEQGPFEIEEPYIGIVSYGYRLIFNISPFPIETDVERNMLEFYGWRVAASLLKNS